MLGKRNAGRILVIALLTVGGVPGFAAPARADCFASDATARDGVSDGGSPPQFYFPPPVNGTADAVGAHFDSCDAAVRVVYHMTNSGSTDVFNVAFGQRPQSDGPIAIFTGQMERDYNSTTLFGTRPKPVPVYAFFRVQDCTKLQFAHSSCSDWSPNITIDLGNNELTAR
jgi:hypothetical protein